MTTWTLTIEEQHGNFPNKLNFSGLSKPYNIGHLFLKVHNSEFDLSNEETWVTIKFFESLILAQGERWRRV